MKLWTTIAALFRDAGEPAILDHVLPKRSGNVAAKKLERARKRAAERHGKQFHTHTTKPRETEHSHFLRELEAKTKPSAIITNISRKA